MTYLENGVCILFEVFERLNKLFSGNFAYPIVVGLPFK